jgi:4,5-DOPA dioxygenase extradiol
MPELNSAFARLAASPRMPALFVGHGSPMNAIEDNQYSRGWRTLGEQLPKPSAILCVSAHWMTRGGTLAHIGERPKTIHDFGGFPRELYRQQYPAPGAPDAAQGAIELLRSSHAEPDSQWGLDHGAWSVLMKMFPKADVPVFQLSLDLMRTPRDHVALAQELKPLREKGVMIIGSGNIVHNLMAIAPGAPPYDWALSYDAEGARKIEARDAIGFADIIGAGRVAKLANPTPEHVLPTLYALGVADEKDDLKFFNLGFDLGSLSMRSFVLS